MPEKLKVISVGAVTKQGEPLAITASVYPDVVPAMGSRQILF